MRDNGEFNIISVSLERILGPTSRLPASSLPEYAFAGRSNCGKSSLINFLLNRRSLARVSRSPGKTRTINYYNVNGEFYFVDLPGYGYAAVSDAEKAGWGRMINGYLDHSTALRMVFLLLDIRHKPTSDDILMYDWIVQRGLEPVIILTKSDKLGKNDKPKAIKLIRETLSLDADDIVIETSSLKKLGREEVYKLLT